jgi:hypothetical protein
MPTLIHEDIISDIAKATAEEDKAIEQYHYWPTRFPNGNTADLCKGLCESYGSKCKGISITAAANECTDDGGGKSP